MQITIANISTKVQPTDFQSAVRAIARQVSEDFAPEWGINATLMGMTTKLRSGRLAAVQGLRNALIYVGDSSEDPTTGVAGALGYHSDNHRNVPYGFIYLDICEQYGENWTCTLSHEVLELLGDPTAAMTVAGPAPKPHAGFVHYDLEVCDPTQGDSYSIDSVVVSNFVGKSYFNLVGGSGKTNFMDLQLDPFGVRPKGYFQYESATGSHQVNGEKVTPGMLAAKTKMAEGRRNYRRIERLGPTQNIR